MSRARARACAALSAAAALAGVLACGGTGEPSLGGTGGVGFELFVSRAAIDEIGAFQIALVKNGSAHPCPTLRSTCLVDQLGGGELVRFEDVSGQSHLALTLPVELTPSGGVRTQDTELRKVPIGKDYDLVIEALSKDATPRLIGNSCTAVKEIRTGSNERIIAEPISFLSSSQDGGTGPLCDPRYEK